MPGRRVLAGRFLHRAILSLILLGLGFKLLLVDPCCAHGVLPLAIATMALSLGIKEAVKQLFRRRASAYPRRMSCRGAGSEHKHSSIARDFMKVSAGHRSTGVLEYHMWSSIH